MLGNAIKEEILAAFETVRRAGTSWDRSTNDYLVELMFSEHPTNSGQLFRTLALGICQRVLSDPEFRGGVRVQDDHGRSCQEAAGKQLEAHPPHDGRWTCHMVIGCFHATLQSYV